jgi:aromatic-L-amino-acid/L-tryptophan decarboxylase
MRARISKLEKISGLLEPSPAKRKDWDTAVQNYAHRFIDNIREGKAFQMPENPAPGIRNYLFDENPKDLHEVLNVLKENLHTCGINPASGGHLGYIPGGGIYPTAMGDYLAAVTNQYAGIFFADPGAVRLENVLIRWMCQLVGYPDTALGNLASGGSIANLIAFVTARDFKKITSDKITRSVIYLTGQVHHCVHKAIRIGGMAEAIVRFVPMDSRYRMSAKALKEQVEQDKANGLNPFLVVASAGTTDTGAMDPLNDIADICENNGLWFHVDAAYGGFFLLANVENPDGTTIKQSFRGIERSDSLAIDPHKGLFLAYGVGAVLIKNVRAQMASHYYRANYMQDADITSDEFNPADLSPELTKHWRGLRMWLPLQLFGTTPFKAALEEKIWLCRYFYGEIQKMGFEVGPYPDLSVCIYRYRPASGDINDFNLKLVEHIQCDGRIFISSTTIDGEVWLRLAVLSFRTHLREIDILLEMFREGLRLLH